MKRILFISLFILSSVTLLSQKTTVTITRTRASGKIQWEILDRQQVVVFAGTGQQDSVTIGLDVNRLYYFRITVNDTFPGNTNLFRLFIGDEPLLFITSDIGKGERLLPFFTGIKTPFAKITGGTSTLISDFPWQVYYISGNFRCGGSIIGNRWILTAAHCTKDGSGAATPVSNMHIRVGVNNPSNALEGKLYDVSDAIVHEGYNDVTLLNDIALLRLTDTINFANAKPIKLVSAEDVAEGAIVPGVMSWVTGWGYTHVNPNSIPISLQKVQLPIVSTAQAATVWGIIPVTDLMAGFLNGNKDACNGDSGGPLVVPVLDEFKLAGIVSWGSADCNTYGAYSRVSDFLPWIQLHSGITSGFKPGKPAGDSIICSGTESSQYSISPIAEATSYEWKIIPASAGVINGNAQNSSVIWNLGYNGPVNIIVRVTINGQLSDWARLDANVVPNTHILSQSGDTILCAGLTLTLNVRAEGYNLNYSWYRNNQVIQSGNSPDLILSPTKADDSGVYKCIISGSCGVTISNTFQLTVYAITNVLTQSHNTEVPFGSDITLNVSSEGHDLVYEWLKDGSSIPNSNTPAFFLQGLDASDIGTYKVKIDGTCGSDVSDTIYLYVKRSNVTSDPQVFVWPSVTTDEISVALNNDSEYTIRIYNSTGTKFRELTRCRFQTRVNISTFARGIYIVEISSGSFRKSVKIIKE